MTTNDQEDVLVTSTPLAVGYVKVDPRNLFTASVGSTCIYQAFNSAIGNVYAVYARGANVQDFVVRAFVEADPNAEILKQLRDYFEGAETPIAVSSNQKNCF